MKHIERGLIIQWPWSELILNGHKTWEIRGSKTNIRGTIAIIQSKTKQIYGYVNLVDCIGPLSFREFWTNHDKHRIPKIEMDLTGLSYGLHTYAWVLENPILLKKPIPYKHPSGAVIWVKL